MATTTCLTATTIDLDLAHYPTAAKCGDDCGKIIVVIAYGGHFPGNCHTARILHIAEMGTGEDT